MAGGPDGKARTGGSGRRWDSARSAYLCADLVEVKIQNRTSGQDYQKPQEQTEGNTGNCAVPRNAIVYQISDKEKPQHQLFVSETMFDRDMSVIAKGAENIKTVTFPNTVRAARDGAFSGKCEKIGTLESAILNEGLERLGECKYRYGDYHNGAFTYSKIKRVTLPSTLKVLGDYTFNSCEMIGQITFRQKASAKPNSDGQWDTRCDQIVLPDTLEKVGHYVFTNCPKIKVIWVGDRLDINNLRQQYTSGAVVVLPVKTLVGNRLLFDLRRLKDLAIPEGVQEIGEQWFKSTDVESVTIPASVTVIGEEAFYGCKNLKRVTFAPESRLRTIRKRCFMNCGIEEITLPKALKEIHGDALNCERLRKICIEEGCEVNLSWAGIPDYAYVHLPSEPMIGKTRLDDLRHCGHVVIPDGIERIGSYWFRETSIISVEFSTSVREIGVDAFCNCRYLQGVLFASEGNLEKIGAGSFHDTLISNLTIPKSVTEIQEGAFSNCQRLRKVSFEEGSKVKTIEEYAFFGCINLTEASLPEGLESIELGAFQSCNSLSSVRFPDGLVKLGVQCFAGSRICNVVLPESVREVGAEAFCSCGRLWSVQLNEGLETLGRKEIIDGVEIEGRVFEYSGIQRICLPSTLKRLEAETFMFCKNLEYVEIPDGVEYIGSECFGDMPFISHSGVQQIMLPRTLKEVAEDAFSLCQHLKTVLVAEGCAVDVRKYVNAHVEVRPK